MRFLYTSVAQSVEHRTPNPTVVGSSPSGRAILVSEIMTKHDDSQRAEALRRIGNQLVNASCYAVRASDSENVSQGQWAIGRAHLLASAALEELDKLVVKETLTPMFGGE